MVGTTPVAERSAHQWSGGAERISSEAIELHNLIWRRIGTTAMCDGCMILKFSPPCMEMAFHGCARQHPMGSQAENVFIEAQVTLEGVAKPSKT